MYAQRERKTDRQRGTETNIERKKTKRQRWRENEDHDYTRNIKYLVPVYCCVKTIRWV